MADHVHAPVIYDNAGRLHYGMILDERYRPIRKVRSMLTELEFKLMEPEPCEECVAMRVVHIIAALTEDFNVGGL